MMNRRHFLRASGVVFALPFLESLAPRLSANESVAAAGGAPKRFVGICNNLGFIPDRFFPAGTGSDYKASFYLKQLADIEQHFTVLDGVSHPGVAGSHASDVSFLTGAPGPGGGGFRNSISLDQYIAAKSGNVTRFPSLTLGVNAKPGRRSLSWTPTGVLIPCESKASVVYSHLFLSGTKEQVQSQLNDLRLGRSIMDSLGEASNDLKRRVGHRDRERLDQYQTAVRDVERRLLENEAWAHKPKPTTSVPQPVDPDDNTMFVEQTQLMLQMAKLALETDSTRAITIMVDSNSTPSVADLHDTDIEISDGYHSLSHHGKSERKLKQLEAIEHEHVRMVGDFIRELKGVNEGGQSLLSNTAVVYGSNLGDANKHTTTNMPMMVAGGGFKHRQILRFDRKNNYPLANLYVSILQQMGIESDRFASSTGTMTGLDQA